MARVHYVNHEYDFGMNWMTRSSVTNLLGFFSILRDWSLFIGREGGLVQCKICHA